MNDMESPGHPVEQKLSPGVPYAERNQHTHYRQPGPMLPERWIDQTTFYDPADPNKGDCMETAVACLLGLPRDHVPSFDGATGPVEQYDNFQRFVESQGFYIMYLNGEAVPNCLYLAGGPAARGCHHVVIMREGQLVHDPHPSRAGLTKVEHIFVLVPADPAYANTMPANPWPEDLT